MRAKLPLLFAILLWAMNGLAQSLAGIQIQPQNSFISQNSTKQLTATFNGSAVHATWLSSDPSIATVDQTGLVRTSATGTGTATITAVSNIFRNSTTVTVVPLPSIASFFPATPLLTPGISEALTATFANGKGVISTSDGRFLNVLSGISISETPILTTTYTLQVSNAAGFNVSQVTTIIVVAAPIINSFYPSAPFVTNGNSVTLFGNFSNGTAAIDNGTTTFAAPSSPFAVPSPIQAGGPVTYRLTVTNAAGAQTAATFTVQAVPPPLINSFIAAPATITMGQSSTLSANFNGGVGTISPGNIPITSGSSVGVSPTATTGYALTVTNQAGTSAVSTLVVTVQ